MPKTKEIPAPYTAEDWKGLNPEQKAIAAQTAQNMNDYRGWSDKAIATLAQEFKRELI